MNQGESHSIIYFISIPHPFSLPPLSLWGEGHVKDCFSKRCLHFTFRFARCRPPQWLVVQGKIKQQNKYEGKWQVCAVWREPQSALKAAAIVLSLFSRLPGTMTPQSFVHLSQMACVGEDTDFPIAYATRTMDAFTAVCPLAFVSRITPKWLAWFSWNWAERCTRTVYLRLPSYLACYVDLNQVQLLPISYPWPSLSLFTLCCLHTVCVIHKFYLPTLLGNSCPQ